MAFKPFDSETLQAIKKLNSLKLKLDSKSCDSRIEFATLVFQFHLYEEIISHDLFDYGLSGRDFDTCFEMGDGGAVVHGLIKAALEKDSLRWAICAAGEGVWDHLYKTYLEHDQQQDMFSCTQSFGS